MGQKFEKSKSLAKFLVGSAVAVTALTNVAWAADPAPSPLTTQFYGRFDAGVAVSGGARDLNKNGTQSTYSTVRFSHGQMTPRLGVRGSYQFENPTLKATFGLELGANVFNGNAGGAAQDTTQNCAAPAPSQLVTVTNNDATATTAATKTKFISIPCNTSNVLFNRGYTLGLASTDLGSIEFGMMYAAPFWVWLLADETGFKYGLSSTSALSSATQADAMGRYLSGPVAAATNVSATNTAVGSSVANTGAGYYYANSVRLRSPNFYGVTGEVFYSLGQNASGTNNLYKDGQAISGNILYKDGNLSAGVGHMTYAQVNDVSSVVGGSKFADWRTRYQNSQIASLRYKLDDLTVGGTFTFLSVTSAGGYQAMGFGLFSSYDLPDINSRVEATFGWNSVSGVCTGKKDSKGKYVATTSFGTANTCNPDKGGDPQTIAYGVTYFYSVGPTAKAYTGFIAHSNNDAANLGVGPFRGDTSAKAFGSKPYAVNTGMFFVF